MKTRHKWIKITNIRMKCANCGAIKYTPFVPALYYNSDGSTYFGKGAPPCSIILSEAERN